MALPKSKAEAIAMKLRKRCARSFGYEGYKRDRDGAVKASEHEKMDRYYGWKEVEVGAAHALRPSRGLPDLPGAFTFAVIGKGAPRGNTSAVGDLPPFQYREDLWRVNVIVTRERDVFYAVVDGKPPRNIESLLACALGPNN